MESDFPQFISFLLQGGMLDLISNHPTLDEFLSSRLSLYHHDASRYPMYFDTHSRVARHPMVPTQFKPTSATIELIRDLGSWALTGQSHGRMGNDEILGEAVLRAVSGALARRERQAITYSFFAPELSGMGADASGMLRRRISIGYTQHYMDFGGGDIATGIRGLEYFERLATRFPVFDFSIVNLLLSAIGLEEALKLPWKSNDLFWMRTVEWRSSGLHQLLRGELTLLLIALQKTAEPAVSAIGSTFFARRQSILSILRAAIAKLGPVKCERSVPLDRPLATIRNLCKVLSSNRIFATNVELTLMERNERQCDVLLVVATQIERDAVLKASKELNAMSAVPRFGKRRTYFDLGPIRGARLLLVQCEKGSLSPGASLPTISDAIDELGPSCVLMVGIAFGIDPGKQKIGEVLVSHQVQAYELQRVGTDDQGGSIIVPRGDRVTASPTLLGRLRAATAGWPDDSIDFGLILSGEKLIDNIDFRDQLKVFEPEALGGAMEAAGLYTAASERKVDWIVVKAICDWADGKKRVRKTQRQLLAATLAARFILHTVSLGGFTTTSSP